MKVGTGTEPGVAAAVHREEAHKTDNELGRQLVGNAKSSFVDNVDTASS